ncbi:hypothetical protein PCE1_002584 [Barthelona sp. PCE]
MFDLGHSQSTIPAEPRLSSHKSVSSEMTNVTNIFDEAIKEGRTLHEHECYQVLAAFGFIVPLWRFFDEVGTEEDNFLDGRFVAKAVLTGVTHKTDIGAIKFNVTRDNYIEVFNEFKAKFVDYDFQGVLFVEMVDFHSSLGGEILLSCFQDPHFGPCVCFGFGGTTVEFMKEIMKTNRANIILPASLDLESVKHIIRDLPLVKLVTGEVRGIDKRIEFDDLLKAIENFMKIINTFTKNEYVVEEFEINPCVITKTGELFALDGVCSVSKNSRTLPDKPLHKIDNLLGPKSAIVAGASAKNKLNPGSTILRIFGEKGVSCYAIHPREREVLGCPGYPNLAECKEAHGKVDLLVVGVPAVHAAPLISQALELDVAESILIITAGFDETEDGKERAELLKQQLFNMDPKTRPVINGPNTVGSIGQHVSSVFVPAWKSSFTNKGMNNAALICQSGGLMISRLSNLADVVNPKVAISVGNQMDLSVTDFLEHFLNTDLDVSVFGCYMEGLNDLDGERFLELLKVARGKGKKVVVYKAGRSKQGLEAAKGHTASMAGDYDMFGSLVSLYGGIVTTSLREFERAIMFCCCYPQLTDLERVGIGAISNAGFEKCAIADHLFSKDFDFIKLCSWTPTTREKILNVFKRFRIDSVVDIGDVLDVTPSLNDQGTLDVVQAMLEDEECNIVLFATVPETVALKTLKDDTLPVPEDFMAEGSLLPGLIEFKSQFPDKIIICSIESGYRYEPFRKACLEHGIACFDDASLAGSTIELVLGSLRC